MIRIIRQWRAYGLPRCAAYFVESDRFCHRLIWPWQDAEGPVDLVHADCKRMEQRHLDDVMDMCPNCVTPWKCNGPHILEAP